MASKRVNVLVYAGNGTTPSSVSHCLYTLRRLLSPNYAVTPISHTVLLSEPWTPSCALLVMPGGADMGYCRTLNGEGNRKISAYVNRGGNYLGFCAGGYYGCSRCEFEVGDKKMEVIGTRELEFFPGTCRGLAFEGFVYDSEAGARAASIVVNKECFGGGGDDVDVLPDELRSYYNGGGVFVDAENERMKGKGVEVLASYTGELHVDSGEGKAAVIYRKIGEGGVILTGPHPEFAAVNLNKTAGPPHFADVVDAITTDDSKRTAFMKACLSKLGLKVNSEEKPVPSLSRIHLSSYRPTEVAELLSSWGEIINLIDEEELIKGEQDMFLIEREGTWGMKTLKDAVGKVTEAVPGLGDDKKGEVETGGQDYDTIVKRICAHETTLPNPKETPNFNHHAYYSALNSFHTSSSGTEGDFGKYLLYGDVITSTNTLLEKNPSLTHSLPTGTTLTATTQLSGRGRGSNIWVSPPGTLMFSTLLRHPISLNTHAPVIFIQYLAALSISMAIKSYSPGYSQMPIRLKWPNDIYALDPSASGSGSGSEAKENYVKIGGILVHSSYSGGDYTLIVGIGLNVSNTSGPTTTLNAIAKKLNLPGFGMERLLANILVEFEAIYRSFCVTGFDKGLEKEYYRVWLHTSQTITLESSPGGERAIIKGITRDWGLLLAEELGYEDTPTGRMITLQSDSNSFDFFKGLVRRKV